jgi:uncharacterized protein YcnI
VTSDARTPLALALVTALWTLAMFFLGVGDALAHLAPVLLILLPLLSGRYPGEEALARRVATRTRRRLRPRPAVPRRGHVVGHLLPRGGRLMGRALAGRAPPCPVAVHFQLTNHEGVQMHMKSNLFRTAAIGGALTLALAAPAAAHITADPAEGPSDGFATVNFQVPHGCEESPTTRVRIQIPPSVPSVTPGRNPYYDLTTKEGRKDKVELHGETVTRGISEIIYTAKTPLPPHDLDILPVSVKLPAGKPGDTVWFPTIQECAEGRTNWVQIPAEGESADDLESPAPGVTLTAADGGHGGGASEPVADVEPAAAATDAGDDDDGAPMWLVVVALAIGTLGLVAGTAGLLRARRA